MSLKHDLEVLARGWRWGRRRLTPASVEQPGPEETDAFPTDWARSTPARAARSFILKAGFQTLLRMELTVSVHGRDVLDEVEPPMLFAANHSSHLDAPLVLTSLPPSIREKTAVGAAADYFFDVWWRAVGTALAFNTFPVERTGSRRSAGPAAKLIEEGWNILVFPEGTRSKDGWVGDLRQGVARLSLEHRIPIVPLALRGTYPAMPRGRGWPAPGRPPVHVRFGRPIYPSSDETAEDLLERVKSGLARELQEDRTDWWDSLKRQRVGNLTDVSGPKAADWIRKWEASRPLSTDGRERVWPAP